MLSNLDGKMFSSPGERCTAGTGGIRCIFDRFLQENTGNSQEFIGKKFQPEYCFHFRYFPEGCGNFSAHFLQEPAGYGGRNLRHGSENAFSFLQKFFSKKL